VTAEELAARFEGARKTSGGYLVRCPAHEDRSPSLSICDSRDGRVLLHCFAGCAFADIVGRFTSTQPTTRQGNTSPCETLMRRWLLTRRSEVKQ